jgi:hypothetical protein
MNSILRYLVLLLLLVTVLPCIVSASSSNINSTMAENSMPVTAVTSSSDWVVTPVLGSTGQISQSIPSFFTCVFGVRIFPGADPVGVYSINKNPNYALNTLPGNVSGHMYIGPGKFTIPGMVFYLTDVDSGTSGLYFAKTNAQGYYEINHVPFGNYNVFECNDEGAMHAGYGQLVNSIELTASNPGAIVDLQV